ncbi:MAG: ChaN family lipoprotein [Methyloceanibacter sp.]|uniref:ChaN family lipoprotein n=1 Tax=Methyloceanibacter sp. TaxID=1965321 RepID=UPI003C46678C
MSFCNRCYEMKRLGLQKIILLALLMVNSSAAIGKDCLQPGSWFVPATGETVDLSTLASRLTNKNVVLLGEVHDKMEHHIWQAHMVSALSARKKDIILAFEVFPRRVQPALDRWIAGQLTDRQFLEETDWVNVWNFDPELYMPLFELARLNELPMLAMNVEQALVRKVGQSGWASVPVDEREDVSEPAAPSSAYVDYLWDVFQKHPAANRDENTPSKTLTREAPAFQSFVRSQIFWDRAMAEAIANEVKNHPDRMVVAILGIGHLQEGWGVAHQLASLGIGEVASLLPWTAGDQCEALTPTVADAIFGLKPEMSPDEGQRPRLGVLVSESDRGLVVQGIEANSIAAATGLQKQDLLLEAAGVKLARGVDLVAIIRRQPPGTWLPVRVERDGKKLQLIARFPPAS